MRTGYSTSELARHYRLDATGEIARLAAQRRSHEVAAAVQIVHSVSPLLAAASPSSTEVPIASVQTAGTQHETGRPAYVSHIAGNYIAGGASEWPQAA
jgi:hypothetical protein